MESTLASELARVQNMVRELGEDRDLPPAAREICGELASRVDRSLRLARSWLPAPDSPGSADGGSPPRGDGDAGSAAAQFKRRTGVPSVRKLVRATSVADTAALDDGFSWRKYGQKDILGAKYPRSYFRCTHRHTRSCPATKQVQRADADPLLFGVVYNGAHTCVGQAAAALEQPGHAHAARDQFQTMTSLLATGGTGGDELLLRQAGGFQPMTPSLSPTPAGTDLGRGYPPLLSQLGRLDWQTRSSSHAAGGGLELDHQFQEFFSTSPDSFQWDFQDIYAAN